MDALHVSNGAATGGEIDWMEYTHNGERERATLGGFECTWDPAASFEQEITLSSAQSRAVSHSVPMTVFLDGEIKPKESPLDSLNNQIIQYMKELVDAEKVKIRFQFCSHLMKRMVGAVICEEAITVHVLFAVTDGSCCK